MTALGIETATSVCGAAIVRDGTILAQKVLDSPHVHSEQLVPMIGEVLAAAGIGVGGLDVIAVSIGPGSFTGLRIGLSVAKGLSTASGVPLAAVPTLEALAHAASAAVPERRIIALVDAHRGEAFGAVYRKRGEASMEELRRPEIASYAAIEEWAGQDPGCILAGSELRHAFGGGFEKRFVQTRCSPASVALIGAGRFQRGERTDASMLEPLYLREFTVHTTKEA